MVNGSYTMGFMLFSLELQEWKLSLAACILINFLQKKPHTGTFPIVQESLRLFQNFSVTQIARLLYKESNLHVFLRIVKNSCGKDCANV